MRKPLCSYCLWKLIRLKFFIYSLLSCLLDFNYPLVTLLLSKTLNSNYWAYFINLGLICQCVAIDLLFLGSLKSSMMSSYPSQDWKLPQKLQIVKPIEGSLTLHQWSRLATPHLGGLLEDKEGIAMKVKLLGVISSLKKWGLTNFLTKTSS